MMSASQDSHKFSFLRIRRSKKAVISYLIISNFINRLKRDKVGYFKRGLAPKMSVEESVNYINRVFNDYLYYGNLTHEDIAGKKILEIGSGDNFGVALKFIANGADKVVCVDKRHPRSDDAHTFTLYNNLINQMSEAERKNVLEVVGIRGERVTFNEDRIKALYGTAIEESANMFEKEQFDIILSRVVLEYIYTVNRVFDNMDLWLKPNGILLHKIDLRYPEIFPHANPLEFLTISERLWKFMTSYSGRPNRKRITYYKHKLESLGYCESTFYIARVIGSDTEIIPHKQVFDYGIDYDERNLELIREIRPRLSSNFKYLSDEELLISDIFMVAKKPII